MRQLVVDFWQTKQAKDEDNGVGDGTDVETPSPSDGISEDTSKYKSKRKDYGLTTAHGRKCNVSALAFRESTRDDTDG